MTTEDLPGGSAPGTAHPAGVVPQPPTVRDGELAAFRQPDFPIALRGYDRAAVDAYVQRVNRVIADLEVSRSPHSAIRHALDQVGEETRGILERAHDTADEITARSRKQASERLEQAEREAREAVDAAEARVRVLDADADEVWHERKRLIDDIQRVSAELAELADAASRRFPAELGEGPADEPPEPRAASEDAVDDAEPALDAEPRLDRPAPELDADTTEQPLVPPSPPPVASPNGADGDPHGGRAA
jgi:DivIVA domain-containing protein